MPSPEKLKRYSGIPVPGRGTGPPGVDGKLQSILDAFNDSAAVMPRVAGPELVYKSRCEHVHIVDDELADIAIKIVASAIKPSNVPGCGVV